MAWFRRRESWVDIGPVADYPPETVRRVTIRGTPIAIFSTDGARYALGDICPHMGGSLSEGTLEPGLLVECPDHTLRFSLISGRCAEGEPYEARVFPTREADGRLMIRF